MIAEIGAEQPDLPPVYTGPTPANPFGGQGYDIFEALERAEEQAALTATAPVAIRAEPAAAEGGTVEPVAPEAEPAVAEITPVEPVASTVVIVPIAAAPPAEVTPEPVAAVAEPEPVAEVAPAPEPAAPEPAAPEPAAAEPAAEAVAGPVIQPIVIGETAAPAEKKRGWWRR